MTPGPVSVANRRPRYGLQFALADAIMFCIPVLMLFAEEGLPDGIFFYEDGVIYFKMETHCHPFNVFPVGGVETGHGGLIRDLIKMDKGGYPLCAFMMVATAPPDETPDMTPSGALHPRILVQGAITGTANYCNPEGLPWAGTSFKRSPKYRKAMWIGGGVGYT